MTVGCLRFTDIAASKRASRLKRQRAVGNVKCRSCIVRADFLNDSATWRVEVKDELIDVHCRGLERQRAPSCCRIVGEAGVGQATRAKFVFRASIVHIHEDVVHGGAGDTEAAQANYASIGRSPSDNKGKATARRDRKSTRLNSSHQI